MLLDDEDLTWNAVVFGAHKTRRGAREIAETPDDFSKGLVEIEKIEIYPLQKGVLIRTSH